MDDNQKVTILLSILGILLIGIGVEVIFMNGGFNKNETNEPNNIVNDNNVKEDNKEKNLNEDNKEIKSNEDNKTENNENKQTDKLVYVRDDMDISSKKANNIVNGLKIDTEYSETFYYDMNNNQIDKPNEDDDIDYEYETITIRLLGTGQYVKSYGTVAGYDDYGTYSVNNGIITLNRKYTAGSDCRVVENKGTEKYKVKNNTIIINDKKVLKENNDGQLHISSDMCELKVTGKNEVYKDISDFIYESETEEVRIEFLPFNHYLMTYCKDKKCGISYGTYSDKNNKLTLNQTVYQAQDSCYYNQNKTFTGSFVEGNSTKIGGYETVTINLTGSQDVTMKEYELVESTKALLDEFIGQPLFKTYCGKL